GSMRFSFLLGPAVGGVLVDLVGFRSTFLVAGAAAALGCLGMLPELRTQPSTAVEVAGGSGFGLLMRRHRGVVARCGTAGFLIMA
ncbi:MAG TPA: MFS transporter, partial [Acidimicrobiaceae bacterium]|nr:MFS transporter [Acidimicrobiaceae bacterium]